MYLPFSCVWGAGRTKKVQKVIALYILKIKKKAPVVGVIPQFRKGGDEAKRGADPGQRVGSCPRERDYRVEQGT